MLVLAWHIIGTTPRTLSPYFSTSVPYIIRDKGRDILDRRVRVMPASSSLGTLP